MPENNLDPNTIVVEDKLPVDYLNPKSQLNTSEGSVVGNQSEPSKVGQGGNVNSVITPNITSPKKPVGKIALLIIVLLLVGAGVTAGILLFQSRQNANNKVDESENLTQTPETRIVCENIKAYDANWNPIGTDALTKLKIEDIVRFSVKCETNKGSFEKIRFSVNNQLMDEVSTKKPESNELYYEYTIPIEMKTFKVTVEVYHSEQGWF